MGAGRKTIFLPPEQLIVPFMRRGNLFVTPNWVTQEYLRIYMETIAIVPKIYGRS